ncbi:methyltransferase domain-containing protein [Stappia taiwanensis]|uniref:Methyltransferase domain-containing protein n=1 Tax=Stappia taiwanensis TaxID=992267 RepID=A0A838XTT6_9HYPH|nr:class I SAM-dependent methyltransferase [Stappia taiwanensis]MBA4613852.1 methyltransferase domain-containing protein [Stappia taiwanensis]GGE79016.1 hypothetical protein GCM10007285_03560 [Stappia taiwanensis]
MLNTIEKERCYRTFLSEDQVIWAYRIILDRDPESQEAIERHRRHSSLEELRSILLNSPEYKEKKEKVFWGASDLDRFVMEVDNNGGPEAPKTKELYRKFRYISSVSVDSSLDPYSDAYVKQQISLHEEISNRHLNQHENEQTPFDMDRHICAPNPYGRRSVENIGYHISQLANVMFRSGLARGTRLLDMGCGWGMTSELFAFAGMDVTAVDINPRFVELINRRREKSGLPIKALVGSFEEIPTEGKFDAVLFYECLHHAVRPWVALNQVQKLLKPGGKLLLAGEPINNDWPNWGLRLDARSVYVMRKHGWFESGWSPKFIRECIERSGFHVTRLSKDPHPVDWIVVAEKI